MKQIIFMRHAKANNDSLDGTDFARELAPKGDEEAKLIRNKLLKTSYKPSLIIASPAARTKKTASYFIDAYTQSKHSLEFGMYEAEFEDLFEIIRNLDDKDETVMMVGHNPSIMLIISFISNANLYKMPTAGIVIVSFKEKLWKNIQKRSGEIVWSLDPKGGELV